ncbi:hypothetical protein, variant [Aphanomyces invadans]|nr:hypothetical protein, variant [Aphanomyces invadans]ETV90611.1 hypothetical protein, variant [Aphanomyces invadans]|eukprot:XP_008880764.1 hypothetical protein, variant [Aphanomyces invadans]
MAQVAASPSLKSVLKIRQGTKATPPPTTTLTADAQPIDHKEFNTRILLAQSAVDILQLVESESNLNHVNILTAFQRFAMFHQRTLHDIAQLKRQRVPHVIQVDEEDSARLDMYKVQLQRHHHDLNLIYSARFWNLVAELERQCQMHIHCVPSRYLYYLLKSLLVLHLAPSTLMENLAAQVTHRLPQDRFSVDKLVHFLHGFAILSTPNDCSKAWMEPTFQRICSYLLTQDSTPELLSMAAWACTVAKVHHPELIDAVLKAANAHPVPGVAFSTQAYQIHLDSQLANLPCQHTLAPSRVGEFKQALVRQQHGNVSSTLHEVVSTTLLQMSVPHTNEYVMEYGYSLDIALIEERIGIEVNGPSHYQLRRNPSEQYLLGASMLKMRHIQRAGWTVIQVAYEDFCKLPLGKPRQEFLSLLLEVAMANRLDRRQDRGI